jgi:hypothetical protein
MFTVRYVHIKQVGLIMMVVIPLDHAIDIQNEQKKCLLDAMNV